MSARHFLRLSLTGGLIAIVATMSACGGGGDDAPAVAANAADAGAQQTSFVADYSAGVAALGSAGGLTNPAFVELFDDSFLDGGNSKATARDNLTAEATAAAAAATTGATGFPMGRLSAATITNCDANNVCTLNATLTNNDADTTAATFTTLVRYTNGKFRLYGDQKTA